MKSCKYFLFFSKMRNIAKLILSVRIIRAGNKRNHCEVCMQCIDNLQCSVAAVDRRYWVRICVAAVRRAADPAVNISGRRSAAAGGDGYGYDSLQPVNRASSRCLLIIISLHTRVITTITLHLFQPI